jgi:hypothetical protein
LSLPERTEPLNAQRRLTAAFAVLFLFLFVGLPSIVDLAADWLWFVTATSPRSRRPSGTS